MLRKPKQKLQFAKKSLQTIARTANRSSRVKICSVSALFSVSVHQSNLSPPCRVGREATIYDLSIFDISTCLGLLFAIFWYITITLVWLIAAASFHVGC
jgi:hypothetical protein